VPLQSLATPRLIPLLLSLALGGCAVDDRGLVRVRHYDGETARMVALDAWGVHVITGASDAGVTLGHSQRTYVFAKEGAPGAAFPLAEMPSRARLRESTGDDVGRLRDLGPPLATIVRTSGLALQTGGSRAGLLLGARLRAALRLPADGSRVLYLSYRAGTPPSAYIRKEE
jgi:hypothetical protein